MSTYLDRTQTAGNRKTFTISAWVKRVNRMGTYTHLFTAGPNPGAWDTLRFDNDDQLAFRINNDSNVIKLNRKFRDTNAWYHIVLTVDTTQATASDRVKIYVNGVQQSSFSSAGYPSQNQDLSFNNNGLTLRIGDATWSPGSQYLDGLMSHVHLTDGTAYPASTFGSTDSTTGEWKISTSPTLTMGTNGFTILKDGNTITDQSSNSNDFSLASGTVTKSEDNPSNNFATFNVLSVNSANGNLSYGNTRFNTGASAWRTAFTSFGQSSGKYYCEMKYTSGSNQMFGIFSLYKRNEVNDVGYVGDSNLSTRAVGIAKPGNVYINGSASNYTGGSNTSWDTGDIIQIAMDRTNKKVYFGKNGTWMGSGDPTSGSTGTGAISFTSDDNEAWGFASSCYASTSDTNFGNGYFASTAVSSAGTNASGNGIFEYDVPAGYTALCTKGINI